MIEIKTISEKYAAMPDSELISFATEEGHLLTPEGSEVLKGELKRRNLDHLIDNIGTTSSLSKEHVIPAGGQDKFIRSYAFEQKENGKSDEDIVAGLMETGTEESIARDIVSNIGTNAASGLKKAELEKLTGNLLLICGIAINFLPLSPFSNRLIYILAWCAIIFGVLKYIKGHYYKSRYKKVLVNIKKGSNL